MWCGRTCSLSVVRHGLLGTDKGVITCDAVAHVPAFCPYFCVAFVVCLLLGMIYWGQEAYKNLDALHGEMKNPAVVESIFNKFDHNHDGCKSLSLFWRRMQCMYLHTCFFFAAGNGQHAHSYPFTYSYYTHTHISTNFWPQQFFLSSSLRDYECRSWGNMPPPPHWTHRPIMKDVPQQTVHKIHPCLPFFCAHYCCRKGPKARRRWHGVLWLFCFCVLTPPATIISGYGYRTGKGNEKAPCLTLGYDSLSALLLVKSEKVQSTAVFVL